MNHQENILGIYNKAKEIALAKNTTDLSNYKYDHVEIDDDCMTVVFEEKFGCGDPDEIWINVLFEDFDKDLEDIKLETEKRIAIKAQAGLIAKQIRDFEAAELKLQADKELYLKLKEQFE